MRRGAAMAGDSGRCKVRGEPERHPGRVRFRTGGQGGHRVTEDGHSLVTGTKRHVQPGGRSGRL